MADESWDRTGALEVRKKYMFLFTILWVILGPILLGSSFSIIVSEHYPIPS